MYLINMLQYFIISFYLKYVAHICPILNQLHIPYVKYEIIITWLKPQ